MKIGVIAEEKNDVEVLYELTCKLIAEKSFTFSHFVGHGCGKLRRKCRAWAENLVRRGCTHLVVIHDLDRNDEAQLRKQLDAELVGQKVRESLVLIPVEELEAWLLADPKAIKAVFSMRRVPKVPRNTEAIQGPKEVLRDIVSRNSKSSYLNTVHNRKIASAMALEEVRRCRSFQPYPSFIYRED